MKTNAKLATLFVASSLVAAASAPAFAASPMSDAFVANVRPNVNFLDSSSRLALTHSSNPSIRSFAHKEAMDQTITANSLVAFQEQNAPVVAVAPVIGPDGGPLSPITNLAVLPLDVATNVTTGVGTNVDNVLTGRSVSIDNPLSVPVAVAPLPRAPLLNSGMDDLNRLRDLDGRSFDALYRSTQMDALQQLATLYGDYLQNGDDNALRAIADRELPKINRRIAELNAI